MTDQIDDTPPNVAAWNLTQMIETDINSIIERLDDSENLKNEVIQMLLDVTKINEEICDDVVKFLTDNNIQITYNPNYHDDTEKNRDSNSYFISQLRRELCTEEQVTFRHRAIVARTNSEASYFHEANEYISDLTDRIKKLLKNPEKPLTYQEIFEKICSDNSLKNKQGISPTYYGMVHFIRRTKELSELAKANQKRLLIEMNKGKRTFEIDDSVIEEIEENFSNQKPQVSLRSIAEQNGINYQATHKFILNNPKIFPNYHEYIHSIKSLKESFSEQFGRMMKNQTETENPLNNEKIVSIITDAAKEGFSGFQISMMMVGHRSLRRKIERLIKNLEA